MSRAFLIFAFISGLGWLIDVIFSSWLVHVGLSPFVASMIGAAGAVSFVYVVSRLSLFGQKVLGGVMDYALYVGWQVLAISVASLLVAVLAHLLEPAAAHLGRSLLPPDERNALALATGAGKIIVTPFTLTANFIFMRWLTERRSTVAVGSSSGDRC